MRGFLLTGPVGEWPLPHRIFRPSGMLAMVSREEGAHFVAARAHTDARRGVFGHADLGTPTARHPRTSHKDVNACRWVVVMRPP